MQPENIKILDNLNEAQREAVINFDVPSLIVAGAGSGKTRVLTSRIAYMLEKGVSPHCILALTFTNKAAREMRERIATMVSEEQSNRLWMGTFHSMFLRILRMEAGRIGYPSSFTIYDAADSRNLIKSIIKEKGLSDESYKPGSIQSRISLAKNNLVTAEAYAANGTYIAEDRVRKMPAFAEIYREYAWRCRQNAAMDFDDILLNINILFKDFPDVLEKYRERFRYILVDEYQDTNYAQYIIIRLLAEKHSRVCVVGDDAQSIYSFRGARIENILRFRSDFPDAKTFRLEQNYRSTRTIVDAANSVIEKNLNRISKEPFSAGEQGEKIRVLKAYTDIEEASLVADRLRSAVRSAEANWSDAAILYRTNMQSRVFEEAFRRRGIPYRIYGGMSFYQRKEIKDVLAYMQLIVNPRDDEAFRRIINYPSRGIGDVTIGRIAAAAAQRGVSCWEIASSEDIKDAGLNAGAEKRVRDFVELMNSLSEVRSHAELYEFGLEVATKTGIIGGLKTEHTPESQTALDNIEELLNSMQLFSKQYEADAQTGTAAEDRPEGAVYPPSVADWLQSITLLTDMDQEDGEERDRVMLMTVHAAKGLEFRYVFVVGLEENLFPSMMSMDGAEGIEEERRLFYVALTRAKEAAFLSFSETRVKWGTMNFCRPSRFLSEIEPRHLDIAFDLNKDAAPGGFSETAGRFSGGERTGYYGRGRSAADDGVSGNAYGKRYGGAGRGDAPRASGERFSGSHDEKCATGIYGRGAGKQPESRGATYGTETSEPFSGNAGRFRRIGKRIAGADESHDPPHDYAGRTSDASPSQAKPSVSGGSFVPSPKVPPHASQGCSGYGSGQRVAHPKFGEGTVVSAERLGNDLKVVVMFDTQGQKTLLAKYANLTILE